MLEAYRSLIDNQYGAAFCTLNACIERCPTFSWDEPVGNLAFCQVVFHTLFFSDLYLGTDVDALREQPFHRERVDFFRDYEELEDRPQELLYDKPTTLDYLVHCREKAEFVLAAETEQSLAERCGFGWRG